MSEVVSQIADRKSPIQRRNKEKSKAKLLNAAIEIFSKFGFDGATTKHIAKRAGVNESLINRYYDSKDGLLMAVIEKFIHENTSFEFTHPPSATLVDELILYSRRRFEQDIERKNLFRITISQCALDAKLCKKLQEILPLRDERFLQDRIRTLKSAGKIRADASVEQISRAMGFQVFANSFLAHMVFGLDKETVTKSIEDFCRTFAKGLSQ